MIRKTKESKIKIEMLSGFQFNNNVIKIIKKINSNKARYPEAKAMLSKLEYVSDQIITTMAKELYQ